MINDQFYKRRYVITAIVTTVVLIYIIRLFALQIVDKSTIGQAESNALLKQTIYPPRGLIYDRNGELLVFNQPIYEVTIVMRKLRKEPFDTLEFCKTLHIDTMFFNSRVKEIKDKRKNRGYSQHTPQVFLSQLSKEDVAELQESLYKFPGIDIRKRTMRDYKYPLAAHVLGSVGEVSQSDIDKDNYYQAGDYSGRDGIERTYERQLRGEKGVEVLLRDSKGVIQGSYRNGELDKDAIKGEDLTLTIDIELQKLAEELLTGKIGSAVAIEPKTGEVLALASSPTWNPALLVGRQRSANYNDLYNDPTKPLNNRATKGVYPPGSTFKTLQAIVCLQEKGITESSIYPCSGKGTKPITCTHFHGSPVNLLSAIEQSCNPYFWCVYRDMLEKDGYGEGNINFRKRYELWRNDVMKFGLGQKFSDSDITDQSAGSIPSIKLFDKIYGETGWRAMTIRSLSIGQGEIQVTPLQLCNMAATIANDGYYITPHLHKTDTFLTHRHETGFEKRYFDVVKEGMGRVMTKGTGRYLKLEGIVSGGKTGTAQAGKGKLEHAVFIGIAPLDEPKIVVAVIVENCGYGATWAAPVASLMMEQYLTGQIKRKALKENYERQILNANVKKR
ncbi:MAG: penicillin-binding protein 2 [Paludibacteraceae bacterium]|nr:penicillin-binding protein 2 [Paludibacteraceae bacterium]